MPERHVFNAFHGHDVQLLNRRSGLLAVQSDACDRSPATHSRDAEALLLKVTKKAEDFWRSVAQ